MKRRFFILFLIFTLYILQFDIYSQKKNSDKLVSGFINTPDSIKTSVYWYWLSNNISKEGIVNDLTDMKKKGIDRAFIGNIGLDDVPYGKVKILTDEWWELLHTALKTATELGIDIGIFNSPGWSQSGGPWVKHNAAMRYLTSSKKVVKGPMTLVTQLPTPKKEFEDVKVIAYPHLENYVIGSQPFPANISCTENNDVKKLIDNDDMSTVQFSSPSTKVELLVETEKPFTARNIELKTLNQPSNFNVDFQVEKNGEFFSIKQFKVERYNESLQVGFDPYAPVVETFEEVTGTRFKLVLSDFEHNRGLAELRIGSGARVERFAEKTYAKMLQTPFPLWKEYQWQAQAPIKNLKLVVQPNEVIDISNFMTPNGTLTWNVPKGDWVIERTGMTPTGTKNSPAAPEATGYEVDKLSKAHTQMHFEGHIGEILRKIPAQDRKAFKVVVQDSYEMGGQNFTDQFFEKFENEYGYSALPYLPVYSGVTVGSQDISDRFLWDMRRLVANLIASEYVGGMKEVSNKNGLSTWLENYGHWGFPGESLLYGAYSDEIGGEFWAEGELGDIENRIASSCAHIYGKTKVSSESFTASGRMYERTPAMLKQRGDRFFAEGINNSLLHVWIHNPDNRLPGINAWFGTEFNRSDIGLFVNYLKRNNYMLQQGLNVADIAYFIGEDAPKMTGITDPQLPEGYQFDYINYDVIMNRLTVKDGYLTLPHGTKYRVLVLPKLKTMRPELLSKIKQLIEDGAIVYGPAPEKSPSLKKYPSADQEIETLSLQMWGGTSTEKSVCKQIGKGMLFNNMDFSQVLKYIGCEPDMRLNSKLKVKFAHRTLPEDEIYFITNQEDEKEISIEPEFRVTGKQPELWLATTCEIRPLKQYSVEGNFTKIPLKLAPNESVFIVFRKKAVKTKDKEAIINFPEHVKVQELNSNWTLTFIDTLRGPQNPIEVNKLQDWTAFDNEKIKYYSGKAIYETNFNFGKVEKQSDYYLNFSNMGNQVEVKINDQPVGGLWTPPYILNISQYLKRGKNKMTVEVSNNWQNRLIGDMKQPEEKRTTWTVHYPPIDASLQKSGIWGNVYISSVKK